MSLPTSGFTTQTVKYEVVTEGDFSFQFTVEVRATGSIPAEDIATVLDADLVTIAGHLEGVAGVSLAHVYKTFEGVVAPVDIA